MCCKPGVSVAHVKCLALISARLILGNFLGDLNFMALVYFDIAWSRALDLFHFICFRIGLRQQ